MRRIAKQPKILKEKVRLAWLIRKNWKKVEVAYRVNPPHGMYWADTFINPETGQQVYIYYQNYVQGFRRGRPNYVRIRHQVWGVLASELTGKQIRELLDAFEIKGVNKIS